MLSDQLLTTLLDAMVDGVFVHPAPAGATRAPQPFVFVNTSATRLLGYSRDTLLGLTVRQLVSPEEHAQLPQVMAPLLRGEPVRFQRDFLRADGSFVPVEVHSRVHWLDGVPHVVSTVRDITARQDAQRRLLAQEQLLELYFQQSLEGIFFMMLDQPMDWAGATDREAALDRVFATQRITRVNQAFADQYGASPEDLLGSTPADFFAHDLEHGRQTWAEFFDKGRLHVQTREQRSDGRPLFIEGDYTCLFDEHGHITGHFGVQRDVTERERSLELLRLQHDLAMGLAEVSSLEQAAERVLAAALSVDGVDGGGIYVVRADQGLDLIASQGLPDSFLARASSYPPDSPQARFVQQGRPWFGRYADMVSANTDLRRSALLKAAASIPVRDEEGVMAVLNVASTRDEELEPSTREALEAIGGQVGSVIVRLRAEDLRTQAELYARSQELLLREINHRVKNNLSAIQGILHLEEDRARGEGQARVAEVLDSVVGRVRSIAQAHELVSSQGWEPVSISTLAWKVLAASGRVTDPEHRVQVQPSQALISSYRAHHLAMVLNELLTNTLKHATDCKGIQVEITTEGDTVHLRFADCGPGYPEAVLQGGDSGTGLELVRGLVTRSLRGQLSLSNEGGAVTVLSFPHAQEPT